MINLFLSKEYFSFCSTVINMDRNAQPAVGVSAVYSTLTMV